MPHQIDKQGYVRTNTFLRPELVEGLKRLKNEHGISMKFAMQEALRAFLKTKGIEV